MTDKMKAYKQKKAIVYDKWLDSLGGGEVVACTIARILKAKNFAVTVVGGKQFNTSKIKQKLNIDLEGVSYAWVWNDEQKLKSISKDADVFFNTTFMDYTHGYGKKNYYYTHFPSEAFLSLKGFLFNRILVPAFSRWVNRVEFVTEKNEIIINRRYGYLLGQDNHILLTSDKNTTRVLSFSLFYENHYHNLVQNTHVLIDNATIIKKKIIVDPHHNIVHFKYQIKAHSSTIGLHISYDSPQQSPHLYPKDRLILLFPKTLPRHMLDTLFKKIIFKFETRMRAGIYVNVIKRIDSYTQVIANSEFTKKWIQKYWNRDSRVMYPPVTFIGIKKTLKKKTRICTIGRFFTLGHGKKQEVMIEAFKQLYDRGFHDWELCLVGTVDINESASYAFVQKLKKSAKGYPIRFTLNASREQMEKIVSESAIYWHATGYQENEDKDPVKFEHFGIAPIEAISAGCIPILYKGGGLPEIIAKLNLSNAHLYTTIDELVDKTIEIIDHKNHYAYDKVLPKLTQHFSMQAFEKNITDLLKNV